jgi:hypothetical protein
MTLDRMLGIAACGLALAVCASRPAAGAAPPARRADAGKLVRIAEDACASAVRALQAPDLRGRSETLRSALERMGSSLAEIQARLEQRDLRFFQMLSTGSRTLAEISVVWPRAGFQDPVVDREIQSLAAAYGRLRNRYGEEWLRYQSGRPLSADETRRFQALQAMEGVFAGRLTLLIDRAQAAGDLATVRDLTLLRDQANRIAQAPATLDEMLNAEVVADAMQGEYDAVRDANPADDAEWDGADQVADDLRTDPSVGFVFSADLGTGEKWSYAKVETDVPGEVADADIPAGPSLLDDALAAGRTTAAPVLVEPAAPAPEGAVDASEAMEEAEMAEAAETAEAEPADQPAAPAPKAVQEAAVAAAEAQKLPEPPRPPMSPPSPLSPPPLRCFLL